MQITVKIDDEEVQNLLKGISGRSRDLSPVMADIAEMVRTSIRRNFKEGGRPDKWKESLRVKREGGQTLALTGRLKNSFTVKSDSRSATVGTNVVYAAVHQFGIGKRSSLKSRRLMPAIPARPFMMEQEQDRKEIVKKITDYLMKSE